MIRATDASDLAALRSTFALAACTAALALPATSGAGAISADELASAQDQIVGHALTPLEGEPITLGDLEGEVVVVNFWATWCKPCQRELPVLDAMHRRLSGQGGRVVAVSIDRDRRKVERFVRERGLTLPVYHDGPDRLIKELDLDHFPFTLVLDRQGHIVYSMDETTDEALAELETRVNGLVNEPKAQVAEGDDR